MSSGAVVVGVYNDLQLYYKYAFPSHFMWKWLSFYNINKNKVIRTGTNITVDGVVVSFNNPHAFTRHLIRNKSMSIYLNEEEKSSGYSLLFYSISVTNYSSRVCTCYNNICSKCWIFMVAAMVIIRHKLENTFGIDDISFFYNGSDMIYVMVKQHNNNNGEWESTSSNIPKSIIDVCLQFNDNGFADLNKGYSFMTDERNKGLARCIVKDEMPDTLYFEWQMLDILFREYCIVHGIFLGQRGYNELIDYCIWNKYENSRLKSMYIHTPLKDRPSETEPAWYLFKRSIHTIIKTSRYPCSYALKTCCYALVFYYLYPRVDTKTAMMPFPFSIHKETNKLVVPIIGLGLAASLDGFDIENVPLLSTIVKELQERNSGKHKRWDITSVEPFIKALHLQAL